MVKEKMSKVNEQWLFLQDVAKLIEYIRDNKLVATGGELWRTAEQQKIYVDKGLSKTMNSKHLERLAIDLNIFSANGKLILCPDHVGEFWESLNSFKNEWGGSWKTFKDSGHFQRNG
jgi:peptidoglycan L-alanyl-D-glutamate endopeptidase CwlK